MPKCKNCQKEFTIYPGGKEIFVKLGVPEPSYCFTCIQIKILTWRNERYFYLRQCDKCHTNMISCFSAEAKHPVYCNACWWNDDFDPLSYGQEFDFSRPFFEQFAELLNKTPVGNLFIANSENSEYTNLAVGNKNSYMTVASDYNDTSAYCSYSNNNRDIFDCTEAKNSELCYDSVDLERCYGCAWSQNLKGCTDCRFCLNCNGCSNCFGCVNLRNVNYHWYNQQLTQDEYEKRLAQLNLNSFDAWRVAKRKFDEFKLEFPRPFARLVNSANCTGDYLINSQDCQQCFNLLDSVNCYNHIHGDKMKDCYDSMGGDTSELTYCTNSSPLNNRVAMSAIIWPGSSNIFYCYLCRTANNCFGCISLHNHRYCILNKQYSEEEYKALMPKIIDHLKKTGEWGEFFPMSIGPWAYNESVGQDLFPLTREEVLKLGGHWQDKMPFTVGKETLKDLPDQINDDDWSKITREILACSRCQRNYKIIQLEADFYKKMKIACPRLCSECRHQDRMKLRNPKILREQQCACQNREHGHGDSCPEKFQTAYPAGAKEKIYCLECYQKEIY